MNAREEKKSAEESLLDQSQKEANTNVVQVDSRGTVDEAVKQLTESSNLVDGVDCAPNLPSGDCTPNCLHAFELLVFQMRRYCLPGLPLSLVRFPKYFPSVLSEQAGLNRADDAVFSISSFVCFLFCRGGNAFFLQQFAATREEPHPG